MIDENPLGYFPMNDPRHSRAYTAAMKAMDTVDRSTYNLRYHNSMIDSDSVDDSIKVKILYNELMSLKTELSNTERRLMGEINKLNADHKRLSDEITAIKQALYFG